MLGKRGDVQVGGEMDRAYMQAVFRRHFLGAGAVEQHITTYKNS